ncbi:TetR/AcrR family transcriptional regulator [Labilithrix luteola]|uniref:TetR/AcrR family transcriptional regulator n=1 Tax=Labilithrix luteola TaxID=1391654 RepID=UPI000A53ECA7|nr:TetR/AcrR family transcriptional regulator [Labilithrix luteola]
MSEKRGLRADAQRNRQRVLDVAQAVFAAEGIDVPVDEIARRAGLGVGTLYRHFPTKEALFAAIVVHRVEGVAEEARALARGADPGGAFFRFFARLVEEGVAKRDFVDALGGAGGDLDRATKSARTAFRQSFADLLERAQGAGAVRADVTVEDILALIAGLHVAVRRAPDAEAIRRLVTVVTDGLAPSEPAVRLARRRKR